MLRSWKKSILCDRTPNLRRRYTASIKIKEGNIYNISNLEIIKGQDNKIGQIKGNFDIKNIIGNFKNNSNYGIEGNLNQNSINTDNKKRFQVASLKI